MTLPSSPQQEPAGFSDADLESFLEGTAFDTNKIEAPPAELIDEIEPDDSGQDDGGSPPSSQSGTIIPEGSGSDDDTTQGGGGAPTTTQLPTEDDDVLSWEDGLVLSRQQARALAEFDAFLASNPELAQQIAGVVQGQYKLVPAFGSGEPDNGLVPPTPALSQQAQPSPQSLQSPQQPPADLDLDDPTIKFLWDQIQQQQQIIQQANQRLQTHEYQLSTQTEATTQSLINRATQSFQQARNLNDDQMKTVKEVAARLNVLESYLQPVDPLSGLPRQVDPLKAIEQAFDTAYWQIPEFRTRQVQATTEQTLKDNTRKAKAASVSGNSGSVRRTPVSKPLTKQEAQQAMIREVAGFFAGETQGDN